MNYETVKENRSDLQLRLQVILDDCARNLNRLHDWAERTSKDRDSRLWGYKEGAFDAYLKMAFYIIGVAHSARIDLDGTRLDRATERGDFL